MKKGKYDREFYINDFKIIEDLDTVKNSIIISLMTRLGELNHNSTYKRFGCGAYVYLKQNNSPLTQLTIKEIIEKSLEKIKGIKNIANIKIKPHPRNPYIINIFFTIKLNNNTLMTDKIELRSI